MRRRSFYRRSFIIAVVLACLPTLIVGLLVYWVGTNQIEREVNRTHTAQLQRASERLDDNLRHLEMTVTLWGQDTEKAGSLQTMDLTQDPLDVRQIFSSLTTMKAANPLIGEAFLYLDNQRSLISESGGVLRDVSDDELSRWQTLTDHPNSIYWTRNIQAIERTAGHAPIGLVVRIPAGVIRSPAALVVLLNREAYDKLAADLDVTQNGAVLLLEDGEALLSAGSATEARPAPLAQSALMEAVARERVGGGVGAGSGGGGVGAGSSGGAGGAYAPGRDQAGSFILQSREAGSFAVSYGTLRRAGSSWLYVSAAPIEYLTRPVWLLSRLIMGIALLTFLISIGLAWIASRRLYEPIRKLLALLGGQPGSAAVVTSGASAPAEDEFEFIAKEWTYMSRESRVLQAKLDQSLPTLRQSFLLQLLQGHLSSMRDAELADRLEQYGWAVGGRRIGVAMINLHGIYGADGKFAEGDEQLAAFAAANIAGEIARRRCPEAEIVNFQDMSIALLIPVSPDQTVEEAKSELYHLTEDAVRSLHAMLKLEATACMGKPLPCLTELPAWIEASRHAFRYRDLSLPVQILDMDELLADGQQEISYPFDIERELLLAVRMGQVGEAEAQLDAFHEQVMEHAATELQVRQALLQLFGNLNHTIMQAGFSVLQVKDGALLYDQFAQLRDAAAMIACIKRDLLQPYMEQYAATQATALTQLVEDVRVTIHESYMKDISLESCADLHGVSPKKLSVAFKQVTGLNFIDYVTQYRIDRAKELMRDTNETINDIAKAVGYQSTYFHRLFKKHVGVTPGQFRESLEP